MRRVHPTTLAWPQGIYYVATGLWPFASMRISPSPVRRPTLWLVNAVGLLGLAIGAALVAARSSR